jgi:hypothetical protein
MGTFSPGTVVYGGVTYRALSFLARAFLEGALWISLLLVGRLGDQLLMLVLPTMVG